jgi:hypothetical protein
VHSSKSRQKGATLIEVVFVVSLLSIAAVFTVESQSADFYINAAKGTGGQLRDYGKAVQKWIADHPGASGSYSGTKWLKPVSCGGLAPAPGYLDCKFPTADITDVVNPEPLMPGSLTVKTIISTVTNAEKTETMGQTTFSPYLLSGLPRADLAGVAAMAALSGNAFDRTMFGSINANAKTAVIAMTTRKPESGDAWLRADGGNTMDGNLSFDSSLAANRRIVGASRIQPIPGQPLIFGSSSGLGIPAGATVVVDSDTEVLGRLLADGGIDSANSVVIASGNTKIPLGNLITKQGLYNSAAGAYMANPGGQSKFSTLTLDGAASITPDLSVPVASRPDPVLEINTVVVELAGCPTNGEVAKDAANNLLSCQGNLWLKVGKSPVLHRFVFTSSGSWTVPDHVTSGFISAAGGGGSGMGWRVESHSSSGHSGGFVMNHQVPMVPGEVIQINVGKGALAYAPVNSGILSNAGYPFYVFWGNPANSGLTGLPGGTTRVTSPTNGLLLECSGGAGSSGSGITSAALHGENNTNPVASVASIVMVPFAPSTYTWQAQKTTHSAAGDVWGPGVCGVGNYGLGVEAMYNSASVGDMISGGRTPFGYGSGGDLVISRCFVTAAKQESCRFPQNGSDGVVMIDVFY